MAAYQTKINKFGATRYADLIKQARFIYHQIAKRTKRRPYVRSLYFSKEKVFFDYFWIHLNNKSYTERRKRLPYFLCAVELIQQSRIAPTLKVNPNRPQELLYRFEGKTQNGETFYVQIKEDGRQKRKYLMSVFPEK